ncbi:nuclear transport factor 2 family protein [Gordonia otitidis]|uniref:nuclear transport factor 2 family protein n=1 Tax=Gordonia otitidis TaxID=249058 RepID=UPI001D13FE28|nr:nuclear transport factor 2 family protein [Gordonia otitidis]UEA60260.1 nuclear transport factor 2 family protein [Gordonia otitidis]
MTLQDTIRERVEAYLAAVAGGKAADIVALYAPEARVEDPVGSGARIGHDAISTFYSALEGVDCDTELLTLRVAGDTAAFAFRVTTRTPDQLVIIEPIDVMTFDDEARITSMRAVWSPDDMAVAPRQEPN